MKYIAVVAFGKVERKITTFAELFAYASTAPKEMEVTFEIIKPGDEHDPPHTLIFVLDDQ